MKLLDRLMARQAKLMASLDPPHVRAKSGVESPQADSGLTVQHDPDAEAMARALAISHLEAGALSAAVAALEPFASTSRDVGTLTTLARIATEQGNVAAAVAALQRAETLAPSDPKVWRLLAKLLTAQRRFREALVYLRRIALVDAEAPASAHVELLRGLMRSFEKTGGPARSQATRAELESVVRRFERAPGIDDSLRLQFAGLYYLLSYGSQDAVRLYNTASPCPETHRDITAILVPTAQWCVDHGQPILRGEGAQTSTEPAVHVLGDVQIHPALGWVPILSDGRALPSGHILQSRHFRGITPESPLMLFRGTHAELRLPRDVAIEPAPALLAGGSASYFETLVKDLSGLAVAEAVGVAKDTPLVVRAGMASFQRDLLQLLGYGGNRLIEVSAERPVKFRSLHVPTPLAKLPHTVDPRVPRWYRKRLAGNQSISSRRIFLAPGPDVVIANEDEVAAQLSAASFERVVVSALSLRGQIDLFSQADQIVAATGEGMTNLLFAPPGARVLELRPVHWAASGGHLHFEPLARACEQRYAALDCLRAGRTEGGLAITVDISRLCQHLESWQ